MGERGIFQHTQPITAVKSQGLELEAAGQIKCIVKNRTKGTYSYFFADLFIVFSSISPFSHTLGFPCLGNGVTHGGLNILITINLMKTSLKQTYPQGQPHVSYRSLRLSSQVIPGYVKLTVRTNHFKSEAIVFVRCQRIRYQDHLGTMESRACQLSICYQNWE